MMLSSSQERFPCWSLWFHLPRCLVQVSTCQGRSFMSVSLCNAHPFARWKDGADVQVGCDTSFAADWTGASEFNCRSPYKHIWSSTLAWTQMYKVLSDIWHWTYCNRTDPIWPTLFWRDFGGLYVHLAVKVLRWLFVSWPFESQTWKIHLLGKICSGQSSRLQEVRHSFNDQCRWWWCSLRSSNDQKSAGQVWSCHFCWCREYLRSRLFLASCMGRKQLKQDTFKNARASTGYGLTDAQTQVSLECLKVSWVMSFCLAAMTILPPWTARKLMPLVLWCLPNCSQRDLPLVGFQWWMWMFASWVKTTKSCHQVV